MTTNPLSLQRANHQLFGRPAAQVASVVGAIGLITLVTVARAWSVPAVGGIVLLMATGFVQVDFEPAVTVVTRVVAYGARSRWTAVAYRYSGDTTHVTLRGSRSVRWARSRHVGRLDLANRDGSTWRGFEQWLAVKAQRGQSTRVSLVELPGDPTPQVLLRSDDELPWPTPWVSSSAPREFVLDGPWWRESWRLMEGRSEYATVLRLVGSPTSSGNLFDALRSDHGEWVMTVHADVVPRSASLRQTRRATHAVRSNAQLAQAWGFLSGALQQRELDAVRYREASVVNGDALLKVCVLIVVRGESRDAVRARRDMLLARARDIGCTLQRGHGLQALWFATAFGGGSSW